jgi:general stress protein 26
MKQLRKTIYIIFSLLLVLTFKSFSQNIDQKDSANNKLINAAREIMTATGTCALITLDEKDLPMVRVMDPFLPESDFTVWFGTNPKSRKVNQIKKNPNVTLYYLESDASGYVVIHGIAQLVDDQREKDKRWKAEWEAFYPNKTEDYLLIKVSPEWMEVISYSRGIVGDPITWEAPVVLFDSIK